MLPAHPQLFSNLENSNAFHSFLVSEYFNLTTVFKQNIDKLSKLKSILILLQEKQDVDEHTKHIDSNKVSPLETILNKPSNSELELCSRFPDFVCKSKYFELTAKLAHREIEVDPLFSFIVIASLYSAESVPNRIRHAMNGRNIFRGNTRASLSFNHESLEHQVHFKLQIKEVSSHFPSGVFHLVFEVEESDDCPHVITKPLIIRNLRVRAKEYYADMMK